MEPALHPVSDQPPAPAAPDAASEPIPAGTAVPAQAESPSPQPERGDEDGPHGVPVAVQASGAAPSELPSPPAAPGALAGTEGGAHRELKLVLTLRPLPAPSGRAYRTVLSVGADGCDPLIEVTEVDGFPAALRAAERFVARAEEHWLTRPRHPAWSPPPGRTDGRPAATRRAPRSRAVPVPTTPAGPSATTPGPQASSEAAAPAAPAAGRDRAGATGPATQLPLFDAR
jgi:hypothetical protein